MSGEGGKSGWRARVLAARAALPPDRLAAAAEAVTGAVLARCAGAARVAAYVPVGREPGSIGLLDGLRAAGTEVLLPVVVPVVVPAVVPSGLQWGRYGGELVDGPLGTRQPAGAALGPEALGTVDAILLPALAVDHAGVRLGRGGGYYDRALAAVPAGVVLAALVHDGELVPRLPADPWDRPVTAVVTPSGGWTELPVVEHHGG